MLNRVALALALLLATPAAQADSGDETGQMSFNALSATVGSARMKKIPEAPDAKLPRAVQEMLDSHLTEVMASAAQAKVAFRRDGRRLEILPSPATALNRIAGNLQRHGLVAVVYDPLELAYFHVAGSYDGEKLILRTSLASVMYGEEDSLLHHESVHALNHLGAREIPHDLRLVLRATGKKDLRPAAMIYPRYLSADELSAYVAELKFLLAVPDATTEIQGDTGVTVFDDKLSIFKEALETAAYAARAAGKEMGRPGTNKIHFQSFDAETNCHRCPAFPTDLTPLVAKLGRRAEHLLKLMEQNLAPAVLVPAMEKELL